MCDRSYGGGGGAFLPHPSMSSPEKGHLNRVKQMHPDDKTYFKKVLKALIKGCSYVVITRTC